MDKVLRVGSQGEDVRRLQEKLAEQWEIDVDGIFGVDTEAVVMSSQAEEGLEPDGIVGPKTWEALFGETREHPAASGEISADVVARMCPGAKRANIDRYLPDVLRALEEYGLDDREMILMAIATIRAETAGFVPISEFVSKWNTVPGGKPYGKYDFRADLGNGAVGDGARYKGRGFVQLTGKNNYRTYGAKIGFDLVNNPEIANEPMPAARLLAVFLGGHEEAIRDALGRGNLARARKLVNGGSHGLAEFTEAYRIGESLMS